MGRKNNERICKVYPYDQTRKSKARGGRSGIGRSRLGICGEARRVFTDASSFWGRAIFYKIVINDDLVLCADPDMWELSINAKYILQRLIAIARKKLFACMSGSDKFQMARRWA